MFKHTDKTQAKNLHKLNHKTYQAWLAVFITVHKMGLLMFLVTIYNKFVTSTYHLLTPKLLYANGPLIQIVI